METTIHSIDLLFGQLGLDSTEQGVRDFINRNSPLPQGIVLHEADFWNPSQASFFKQMIDEDSNWAEIVDQLNCMLR